MDCPDSRCSTSSTVSFSVTSCLCRPSSRLPSLILVQRHTIPCCCSCGCGVLLAFASPTGAPCPDYFYDGHLVRHCWCCLHEKQSCSSLVTRDLPAALHISRLIFIVCKKKYHFEIGSSAPRRVNISVHRHHMMTKGLPIYLFTDFRSIQMSDWTPWPIACQCYC
jgi:hypothetical protein